MSHLFGAARDGYRSTAEVAVRRWSAVLLGGLGLALVATPALGATQGVRVGSFYFEDATAGDGRVVVDQGDRIRFTFEGGAQHTATVDGQFDSGTRSSGQTWTTPALTRAGTYTLYCEVHGASRHSTSLVVRPTAAPSPSPAPSPRPSAAPSPSPKAKPSKAAASVSPRPVRSASAAASPSPARTAAPSPSPSLLIIPAPSDVASTTAALPAASPSASPSPSPLAEDVGSVDSSGTGFLIPWWLVLLVLLALAGVTGAVLAARRRRTP